MILLIDNYDSFSYNLYQFIGEFNPDIMVVRNDELTIEQVRDLNPSHIILSPGPKRPSDAGICIELVQKLHTEFPILGICLGHQAICEAFGAKIVYAKQLMHGKTSIISVKNENIFKGLTSSIPVARYHSLAADNDTMPDCLTVTASTDDGEIMAVKHSEYPTFGLQFHPESILTPQGKSIIKNFLGGNYND